MDTAQSDQPLGIPPQLLQNQQTPPPKIGKKLNWKGFFIGIIVVIIIEYFAVTMLQSENKQPAPPAKPSPTKKQQKPTPRTTKQITHSSVTQLAIADLAKRLHINANKITVVSEDKVTWHDGSMGCAEPGRMYTQIVIKGGTKVVLSANATNYNYHAGPDGKPFLCKKPTQ